MFTVVAFTVFLVASAVNVWAKFRLLYRFRVNEYLTHPEARLLYWASRICVLLTAFCVLAFGYASGLRWIEIPAWLAFALILWLLGWSTYMRFSGKYAEYYRAHQWR